MNINPLSVTTNPVASYTEPTQTESVESSSIKAKQDTFEKSEPEKFTTYNSKGEIKETTPELPQSGGELTESEKQEIKELKVRDGEVRAHEQAHMAAGGGLVRGGASYSYQKGPDGKSYANGGEVSIDTSEAKDPKATIAKMARVKAAALAPANPSGTDRQVAAEASAKATEARAELAKESQNFTSETDGVESEIEKSV